MSKTLAITAFCLGLLVLAPAPGFAQPTPEDLTIRPDDKIEWTAPSPHFLRVGATGLTPLSDVNKILSFSPPLDKKPGDVAEGKSDVVVTGTVLPDADKQGVPTFVFTCGQHPAGMLSRPFTVAARAREAVKTLRIRAEAGQKWMLKREDGTEVQIDTTP
jgi:hypothetical protein